MTDNLTPAQRHRCMTSVRNKDTDIEQAVRSALHRRGLRFRKHVRHLPGRPDVVFPRARVAVFVDGDFWHGHDFESWRNDLDDFWRRKIQGNVERDLRNTAALEASGWTVLRIWKHQVKRDLDGCVELIFSAVSARVPTDKSAPSRRRSRAELAA